MDPPTVRELLLRGSIDGSKEISSHLTIIIQYNEIIFKLVENLYSSLIL